MQRRNLSAAAFGAAALGAPSFAATASPSAPKWDETFDVIIVGSGSAGLTAAVRCKNLGIKRVLVIEKLPVMGGNSCIAVGDICAVDSPITRKAGTKDSVETTSKYPLNLHMSPHWGVDIPCGTCHKQHERPTVQCAACHTTQNYKAR